MSYSQLVYNRLIVVASSGKVIPLCEIANLLELDAQCPQGRAAICRLLNEISCQENAAGRPLLSAVVVLPEIGYPEMGFFLLARELGINTCCDERSFFYHELNEVHKFWKEHIPVSEVFQIRVGSGIKLKN